jgi:hypothetical protein
MKKVLSSILIMFMTMTTIAQSANDNFVGKWKN